MGRPRKLTLDFFLHDANASSDRKIKILTRKHGNDGYAVYFRCLEMMCREEGMRLDLSNPFDVEICVDEFRLRDDVHLYNILETCVSVGLFDSQLWHSDRILFSHGLHNRYKFRLEERKADLERKKRKKEALDMQARIEKLDSFPTGKLNIPAENYRSLAGIPTDPDPKTNLKPDLKTREREKNARENDFEKSESPEPSLSPCQENSKEPETEQATALDVDRPPNSATPPHAAPSKIASKPPQNLLPTHPYPGLVEQGLESLWTGANQTGANRLRSFDPDLVTGVIEHLTKYNLPNKRGDAIGCILNAIHQGQWGKLLGWYESGKAQNAPPIDAKSLVEKAIAAESAKRSWVQSKCAEGTTPDQALRLWDSLSTQERNSLLTEV